MDQVSSICAQYAKVFSKEVLEPVSSWCRAERARLSREQRLLAAEPVDYTGAMDREIRAAWLRARLRTVERMELGLEQAYRDFSQEIS